MLKTLLLLKTPLLQLIQPMLKLNQSYQSKNKNKPPIMVPVMVSEVLLLLLLPVSSSSREVLPLQPKLLLTFLKTTT
jgi:hypothetical protein